MTVSDHWEDPAPPAGSLHDSLHLILLGIGSMTMILCIPASLHSLLQPVFRCTIRYLDVVATVVRHPTPKFMHEIKASKRLGRSLMIKMRL